MELTRALRALRAALAALGSLTACEVPDPPPETGGTDGAEGACGPGLVVVSTDYQSSSVAFVGWDGEVISPHVLSSGSTEAALSAPLSGDVVAPTAPAAGGELVLVDRYPASVLTWVDPVTGAVLRQLSVRTGFDANAQDHVALSADKSYVSRLEVNPAPGREPFDGGSDVLVLDPSGPSIVGRIDLAPALLGEDPDLLPSPSRLALAGEKLVVLLSVYSRSFALSGDARVVVVDPEVDAIVAVHRVTGLRGCSAMDVAPDGARIAVGCSGTFGGDAEPTLEDAGVVVLDLATGAELTRVAGGAIGAPPAFSIAFADDRTLLVPTFGAEGGAAPARPDTLERVSLDDGAVARLVQTDEAFQLGEVRCAPACGVCFLADAERGALHRVARDGGDLVRGPAITVDDGIGLPPRYLGAL